MLPPGCEPGGRGSERLKLQIQVVTEVPPSNQLSTEGDTVTLDCLYNSSSSNDLFWYKQDGNNRPRFILSRFKIGQGKTENEFKERFSSRLNSTFRSVPLKIQKLHVSDSAVYYCALRSLDSILLSATTCRGSSSTPRTEPVLLIS
uniref:Ig-like domain-containing protein n=1 Tax=Anabas testudineus TaxID=64144 RepID=A0AAQ6ICY2_ANATE